jgi:two-component system sensor histidine kinase YesM
VPRFILQPIIENCFTHAFIKSANEGLILVQSRRTEQGLVIRIEDNGTGMEAAELDRLNDILAAGVVDKGIGLTNSNLRIRLYYGKSYGIRAELVDSGTGLAVNCLFPVITSLDIQNNPAEENDK